MKQELDRYIQQYMDAAHLPGLAIGIVKDRQIIYSAGFGVKDVRSSEKVTPASLFHTASISKLFVATAVMQLVEQGIIALDDSPVKHLPYFNLADERYEQITIRQMLSHVSGIPDLTDYQWGTEENDSGALERYVRSLHNQKLLFTPGDRFAYSNIAYEVLGDLIAKASGTTFEDYIKLSILEPLGMTNSTFLKNKVPHDLATTPHLRTYTNMPSMIYPYNRAHAPSSTLHSSAQEMCNFAIANLEQGVFNHVRFLSEESCNTMQHSHAFTGSAKPYAQQVGIGWFLGEAQGMQTRSHSGHDLGFCSFHLLLPQESIGITVLCNAAPAHVENLAFDLACILLGKNIPQPQPAYIRSLGGIYETGGLAALRKTLNDHLNKTKSDIESETDAMLEISSALIEMGQFPLAVDFINLALEYKPENAAAYELLAMISFFQGNLENAERYARLSLKINPENPTLNNRLQQLSEETKS